MLTHHKSFFSRHSIEQSLNWIPTFPDLFSLPMLTKLLNPHQPSVFNDALVLPSLSQPATGRTSSP